MASRRKEQQEDAKLRMLQMICSNPQITSRELALKIKISNGSSYYMLSSLIEKGFIKLSTFRENSKRTKYSYLLTPKGIRAKSVMTNKFLVLKKYEFELLKQEIRELERDAGLKLASQK